MEIENRLRVVNSLDRKAVHNFHHEFLKTSWAGLRGKSIVCYYHKEIYGLKGEGKE